MKLVIEIPDNEYHQICELRLHNRTFYDDAIRNGTPLPKVIEDIKAEIIESQNVVSKTLKFNKEDCFYNGKWVGFELALAIIDKHIGKEHEE